MLKSILVLTIALLIFNYQGLVGNLYRMQTLTDSDKIVYNFRNMDKVGFHYNSGNKGDKVAKFTEELNHTLPDYFAHDGQSYNMTKWLADYSTTGLVILKVDNATSARLLYEDYYLGNSVDSKVISWSTGKSIVSALIGIAISEGKIESIYNNVADYAIELKNTSYDGVTIENVLQMSSGVKFNENYFDFWSDINNMGRYIAFEWDLIDLIFGLERKTEQGTFHKYISIDTQILGMVLKAAVNSTLTEYLQEKIWKKIGAECDFYWLRTNDNSKTELAIGTINACVRDFARFGWLYLNKGKSPLDGTQLLSEDWVSHSVTPYKKHLQPNPKKPFPLGYGYQWWVPEFKEVYRMLPIANGGVKWSPVSDEDYLAIGVYGQFIYVSPKNKVVIAKYSAYADYDKDNIMSELIAISAFERLAEYFGDF